VAGCDVLKHGNSEQWDGKFGRKEVGKDGRKLGGADGRMDTWNNGLINGEIRGITST
jgi:hypothetical protein